MEKTKSFDSEFLKNLTAGCKGLKDVIASFEEQNKKLEQQINKFKI